MKNYLSVTAGLATIATVGFGSYQLAADDNKPADEVRVNIINSIDSTTSNLSTEQKSAVDELLTPLKELVSAAANTDAKSNNEQLATAKKNVKSALQNLSLVSYQGKASPFVPPLNKVQLLCNNDFSFIYAGQYRDNSLNVSIKINGKNNWLNPGDMKAYKSNGKQLTITYMEYLKQQKGPVIKYECLEL